MINPLKSLLHTPCTLSYILASSICMGHYRKRVVILTISVVVSLTISMLQCVVLMVGCRAAGVARVHFAVVSHHLDVTMLQHREN